MILIESTKTILCATSTYVSVVFLYLGRLCEISVYSDLQMSHKRPTHNTEIIFCQKTVTNIF